MLWKCREGPGLLLLPVYHSQWVRIHQARGGGLSAFTLGAGLPPCTHVPLCSRLAHGRIILLHPLEVRQVVGLVRANGLWAKGQWVALRLGHLFADGRCPRPAPHWHGDHRNTVEMELRQRESLSNVSEQRASCCLVLGM